MRVHDIKAETSARNFKGCNDLLLACMHTTPLTCQNGHCAHWAWHTYQKACHKCCSCIVLAFYFPLLPSYSLYHMCICKWISVWTQVWLSRGDKSVCTTVRLPATVFAFPVQYIWDLQSPHTASLTLVDKEVTDRVTKSSLFQLVYKNNSLDFKGKKKKKYFPSSAEEHPKEAVPSFSTGWSDHSLYFGSQAACTHWSNPPHRL